MKQSRTLYSLVFAWIILYAGEPLHAQSAVEDTAVVSDSMQIVAVKAKPGKPSIYRLILRLSRPIPKDAVFELVFPEAFGLDLLEVAGAQGMKGGIQLAVDGQKVVLRRTGLGKEVRAGEKVVLKMGLIKNPPNLEDEYRVTLTVRSKEADNPLLKSDVRVAFQLR